MFPQVSFFITVTLLTLEVVLTQILWFHVLHKHSNKLNFVSKFIMLFSVYLFKLIKLVWLFFNLEPHFPYIMHIWKLFSSLDWLKLIERISPLHIYSFSFPCVTRPYSFSPEAVKERMKWRLWAYIWINGRRGKKKQG